MTLSIIFCYDNCRIFNTYDIFRYINFIDKKVASFQDKIIKDRPVAKITYSDKKVSVVTKLGKQTSDRIQIDAEYAISTIPLGVLQKGDVRFDPPFSKDKHDAIKDFVMGNYEKIYVQYPINFWGESEVLYSINPGTPASESIMTWGLNLDIEKYFKGSRMLTFHSMGPTAKRITRQDTKETMKEVDEIMEKMFPNKAVRAEKLITTDWANDPYSYGSWSAMPENFSKSQWDLVRQNEKRLYFAGEHTSANYGFVHSAYETGQKAAEEIYEDIQGDQTSSSTTRKYCTGERK